MCSGAEAQSHWRDRHARRRRPYAVPISYAYAYAYAYAHADGAVYAHAAPGHKVALMPQWPKVAFQVSEIQHEGNA
jgi:nitroimidazol reductase NimA-like FMN-containing flavoprotein (pyridoxamine 5'-phosphate oxidase superfamily)